jgi:hypothetical protein
MFFFTKVKGDGMVDEEMERERERIRIKSRVKRERERKISVRMGKHGMRKIFSSIQVFRSKGSLLVFVFLPSPERFQPA